MRKNWRHNADGLENEKQREPHPYRLAEFQPPLGKVREDLQRGLKRCSRGRLSPDKTSSSAATVLLSDVAVARGASWSCLRPAASQKSALAIRRRMSARRGCGTRSEFFAPAIPDCQLRFTRISEKPACGWSGTAAKWRRRVAMDAPSRCWQGISGLDCA